MGKFEGGVWDSHRICDLLKDLHEAKVCVGGVGQVWGRLRVRCVGCPFACSQQAGARYATSAIPRDLLPHQCLPALPWPHLDRKASSAPPPLSLVTHSLAVCPRSPLLAPFACS